MSDAKNGNGVGTSGNDEGEESRASHIAIIGMAGRFPGAKSVAELWENLKGGVESVTFFTDEQLLAAGESPELVSDPAYVKAWPVLDGIAMYDAAFFGHSPRDAAIMDPQHRFFLEVAWETLENAGYLGETYDGPIGVFATGGINAYMMHHLVQNQEIMDTVGEWLVRHIQNDPNFLATRVSYELGLKGPSMTVQTACSSTLVAIHMAAQSLLNGECDMALAGGSTIMIQQDRGYLFKDGEILSSDGHCRPFDASSKGTLFGSGTGAVLLKRYDDALADGDNVLAVIRGSAINNDGASKVGFLAPSVEGQSKVISEALAVAGTPAESISYVEAHGTATLIGDPIEVTALVLAYRATTKKKQFCGLGSIKSNIGHLGEAAGAAGIIKTVLSLANKTIVPSINFDAPNPNIDFAESPFYVATTLKPWPEGTSPRRAGITALGAGGTNVHVILEEAPEAGPGEAPPRGHELIVLSAKTESALATATQNLARHLKAYPEQDLADVAYTLHLGRKAFAHRRSVVVASRAELVAALESVDPKRVSTSFHKGAKPSVVYMFPGGGAQYARMGKDLYDSEPVYRDAVDACLASLAPSLATEVRAVLFAKGDAAALAAATRTLERPSLALPALFATSYALAKLLMAWGITPAAMIGHSAGEYVAACLSGVVTFTEGMALVALRGRLFETLPAGGMLSVSLSENEARAYMGPELSFAAINAPDLCVASGPVAAIAAMEEKLRAAEIEHTRIHIDVAAHSQMLEPILAELERFCRTVPFKAPTVPYVSNLTGTWMTAADAKDPQYWVRHLRSTVRFADGLATLLADGNRALVEVGPGRTLSSLGRSQPKKPVASLSTVRHPKEEASDVAFLLGAVGKVWGVGASLDWNAFHDGELRQRVPLPTYPFERQRFWVERGAGPVKAAGDRDDAPLRKKPDVADWFYLPSWKRSLVGKPARVDGLTSSADVDGGLEIEKPAFLVFVDDAGLAAKVLARLEGHVVTTVEKGKAFTRHGENAYAINPASREDYDALVADLEGRGRMPQKIVHMWAVTPKTPVWARVSGRANAALAAYETAQTLYFYSLLFLAQSLTATLDPITLTVVSNNLHQVAGETELLPEKATLLGPCRVIPRELPNVSTRSVDVVLEARGSWQEARLVDQLTHEIFAASNGDDAVVAYRGDARWVESIEPVRLEAPSGTPYLRAGGVYLITGGLGGIGLEVAEHLARAGKAAGGNGVKLVLVGRAALPSKATWNDWLAAHGEENATSRKIRRVEALLALGAEVVTASADVTERAQMQKIVADTVKAHGAIHGVIHAAGQLNDVLIELRPPVLESEVIATKVKGALVLDAIFHDTPLDFFLLFSSVSSLLGLPGQVDYTAANAFLDAFAQRKSKGTTTRTISIDWSAWQEVGMAAALFAQSGAPRPYSPRTSTRHPLWEHVTEGAGEARFRTELRLERDENASQWLLTEHVVKGAEALIPGTGFLELARAALANVDDKKSGPNRAVELRDVVFLAPFAVRAGEARELHLKLARRAPHDFVIFSTSEAAPHVVGKVLYADADAPRTVDLAALETRCNGAREDLTARGGFPNQQFMDFGPRWGNLRYVAYGKGEALIALALPEALAGDLDDYRLHPALLDMATGAAQALVPGFDRATHFFVPFSYGLLRLRGGLPRTLFSHVRLRATAAKDSAAFDITLYDAHGVEVADITEFVMRRVTDVGVMAGATADTKTATTPSPSPLAASWSTRQRDSVIKEGILPAEGVDAFARILARGVSAQVLVSSVDLPKWIARTTAAATAPANAQGAATGGAATTAFTRPNLSTPYQAPRNAIEQKLATFFRELLGVENVGVFDDFFELGGQSLIAVRLFNKVRKEYGVDLPLSTLFEAPTIAQCSDILHAELGIALVHEASAGSLASASSPSLPAAAKSQRSVAAAPTKKSRWSSLVPMQPKGSRVPFYCVAGMGGNLANLRKLALRVGDDQPFYGLQPPGLDGKEKRLYRVEDLAAHYVREVLAFQAEGPFLLGGYSGGGVAAYEMARQLTAAGHAVAFLGFLDSYSPALPEKSIAARAKIHAGRVVDTGPSYVVDLAKRRLWYESQQANRRVARVLGKVFPEKYRYDNIGDSWITAESVYRPGPLAIRATLFRAAEETALSLWTAYDVDAEHGWGRYVKGGVEVILCPGNHTSMCEEPHVQLLALKLRGCLDGALAAGIVAAPVSTSRPPTLIPPRDTTRA